MTPPGTSSGVKNGITSAIRVPSFANGGHLPNGATSSTVKRGAGEYTDTRHTRAHPFLVERVENIDSLIRQRTEPAGRRCGQTLPVTRAEMKARLPAANLLPRNKSTIFNVNRNRAESYEYIAANPNPNPNPCHRHRRRYFNANELIPSNHSSQQPVSD
ncbi:hypothetical protein V9T40_010544 [Parthenolecanium corni]|uniref:Uncharacterized protein n=1 Tax=Parthenolecanium corni TaxID=536013 RepID=A0AAN9T3R8_9HEMI